MDDEKADCKEMGARRQRKARKAPVPEMRNAPVFLIELQNLQNERNEEFQELAQIGETVFLGNMQTKQVFCRCAAAFLAGVLVPCSLSIAQEASVSDQITALTTAHQEKVDAFYKEYRAASTDEERTKIAEKFPDGSEVGEKLMSLVAADPAGKDAAVATKWMLRNVRKEPSEAVTNVIKAQALTEGFDDLALACMYAQSDAIAEALDLAIEKNPRTKVKAAAAYVRSTSLSANADPDEATKAKRQRYLDLAVQHGAEVMLGKRSLADRAASTIFELENLQIGNVAPDIKGEDIDGVEFALSEYRGKVVVIDFWGDW